MTPLETALLAFLTNLPTYVTLGASAIAFIQQAVADFKGLGTNATQADIDALVDKIKARSAEIQAIP